MIACDISYTLNGGKKTFPLRLKGEKDAEVITVAGNEECLKLVFSFYDPRLNGNGKPLSGIEVVYSWAEFAANPEEGQKAEKALSTFGRKKADSAGKVTIDFPLVPRQLLQIFFRSEVVYLGKGAYQDDFLDLDIPIKRDYNRVQENTDASLTKVP